jgi:hypothetical protein
MAFSVSPSVIVREIDATATIPAISTSPGAIAGVFRWGPTNERTFITSEAELVRVFGEPTTYNAETFFTAADFLAYSNSLYVTRVSDGGVNGGAGQLVNGEDDAGEILDSEFIARYPGELGNSLTISYVTSTAQIETTITGFSIEVGDNTATITQSVEVGDVLLVGDNQIGFQNMTIVNVEEDVVVEDPPQIEPDAIDVAAVTSGETTILETDGNHSFVEGDFVEVSGATGLDINGIHAVIEIVSATEIRVDLDSTGIAGTYDAGSASVFRVLDPDFEPVTTDVYNLTFGTRYFLSQNLSDATVTRRWRHAGITGPLLGSNTIHIVVANQRGVLETYENLSTIAGTKTEDGSSNYYKDVINRRSSWIFASGGSLQTSGSPVTVTFDDGEDGSPESSPQVLGAIMQGYALYEDANDVDISFVLQGKAVNSTLPNYLISNIADARKDCMVYISPRREDVIGVTDSFDKMDNILDYRNGIQSSSYWVMDTGYKYRYDKYNDVYRWVPLNGDIAGLSSRVDPWESPAGYKRGIIKNVVKLAYNPNKDQRDRLYGRDINPVISQVGQGVLLFGDKTGLGNPSSAFSRINVRRLFITVEKAIATISATFLFDFNDEFTRTQFKNMVEPLLRDIQGRRGITDFRVVSDERVNTPDVVDRNIFRGNIFISPARSINIIELTFVATRTGVEFDEIVGQAL